MMHLQSLHTLNVSQCVRHSVQLPLSGYFGGVVHPQLIKPRTTHENCFILVYANKNRNVWW
jgi:hypothetical protein